MTIMTIEGVSAKIAFPSIVPDFVIELRSMADNLTTLQAKMLEYQANGVRLGWLINPLSARRRRLLRRQANANGISRWWKM
jgi:Uma2 family endonuclease